MMMLIMIEVVWLGKAWSQKFHFSPQEQKSVGRSRKFFFFEKPKNIDFWWFLNSPPLIRLSFLLGFCFFSSMLNVSGTLAAHSHTYKYIHFYCCWFACESLKWQEFVARNGELFQFSIHRFDSSDCHFPSSSSSDLTILHSKVDTMKFSWFVLRHWATSRSLWRHLTRPGAAKLPHNL